MVVSVITEIMDFLRILSLEFEYNATRVLASDAPEPTFWRAEPSRAFWSASRAEPSRAEFQHFKKRA